jgi:hypothetical protein
MVANYFREPAMRYSLRMLLIAATVGPPVIAWLWMVMGYFLFLPAIYVAAIVLILDRDA